MKKYYAEMIGTMVLVLIGCGAAIQLSVIGIAGVSLAFGITIIAIAYSLGNISGAHLNPAVTVGMLLSKRIELKDAMMYILFQVIGAFIGAFILAILFGSDSGLGINFVQEGHTIFQAVVFETFFTFVFVLVILGVTSSKGNANFAGLTIGMTLIGIHLVGIGITGTGVNPARSLAPAIITMDPTALSELWIFLIAPLVGGALASLVWKIFENE